MVVQTRGSRRPLWLLVTLIFSATALALLTACTAEVSAELAASAGINAIRVQGGLPPLQADRALVEVARIRSRDMAAKNYFSHTPPDGCNFVCIMDRLGIPHAYAGENIVWNNWDWPETAAHAVSMWHNSPPHLENIMNCHYTRFGTGVAKSADGKIYFTMIFEGDRGC